MFEIMCRPVLRLRVTVCVRENFASTEPLYLDKGSSYEAETNTKM